MTTTTNATPTNVQQINYGFAPETAPYAQQLLGQAQALTDVNQNPFQQYQGETVAQFTPLQQTAFTNAQNMQTAPQLQDASAMAGMAGLGGLNTQYTFQPSNFTAADAQSLMNPYLQASLAPQLAIQQQLQGAAQQTQNAQATQAGAFGGSRAGVQAAATNLNNQLANQNLIGQGYYNAFNNAQNQYNTQNQLNAQQQQFGAGLGMQGLNLANSAATNLANIGNTQYGQNVGIIGLQNQLGTQQQQQVQNIDNQQYQNFLNYQNYPYQQLNFMQNMIRGLPMTNQTAAVYQSPGSMLGQVAGLGIGAAAALKAEGGSVSSYKDGGVVGYADGGDIVDPSEADIYKMMGSLSDQQIQQILQHPTSMAEQQAAQQEMSFRGAARMREGGPVAFKKGGDEGEEDTGSGLGYLAAAFPGIYQAGKAILSKVPTGVFSGLPTAAGRTAGSGLSSYLGLAGESAMPASAVATAGYGLSDLAARGAKENEILRTGMMGSPDTALGAAIMEQNLEEQGAKKKEAQEKANDMSAYKPRSNANPADFIEAWKKPTVAPKEHPIYHEARETAVAHGHDANDFDANFDKILSKLSKGDEEHLKGINDLIAAQLKEPERIKEEGKNQAMMNYGFQLAAHAAQPGVAGNQGFAGLLRSAAAAGPEYAKSISDTDKMAADAKKLAIQLQVDQARYQTSLDKGNKRDAVQIYQNMQDNMMKQQQLGEMIRHNKSSEGLMGQRIAAAGASKNIAPYLRALGGAQSQAIQAAKAAMADPSYLANPKRLSYDQLLDKYSKQFRMSGVGLAPTGNVFDQEEEES